MVVSTLVNHATGNAERDGASVLVSEIPGSHRITVGADKGSGRTVGSAVILDVLSAADAESLQGKVLKKIWPGTRLLADEWRSYLSFLDF